MFLYIQQQFGESSSSQTEKEDKADKGGEEFKMRSVTVSPLNTRYLDSVIFNSPTGSPKTSSWLSSGMTIDQSSFITMIRLE